MTTQEPKLRQTLREDSPLFEFHKHYEKCPICFDGITMCPEGHKMFRDAALRAFAKCSVQDFAEIVTESLGGKK